MTIEMLVICDDEGNSGILTSPVVKLQPGNVHWNGFSPLCVRECVSERSQLGKKEDRRAEHT